MPRCPTPDAPRRPVLRALALWAASLALGSPGPALADALEVLQAFGQQVNSGRAAFTQTVTSPDGQRSKTSSGSFEFLRPGRFRFHYSQPFEQLIVADGQQIWLYDPDLNQVSVRPLAQALGATPAALLAGGALNRDFELRNAPSRDGLDWVQATPRKPAVPAGARADDDGGTSTLRRLQVGFQGRTLAALEIVDAFGQRSLLRFTDVQTNPRLGEDRFRFTPPPGADLVRP